MECSVLEIAQREKLAHELGISRTPVREALRKLEIERLVDYTPHRGAQVANLSKEEIDDLYEVRISIERKLIRKAAINATPEDVAKLRQYLTTADMADNIDERLAAIEQYNNYLTGLYHSPQLEELQRRIRSMLKLMVSSGHMDPIRAPQAAAEHRRIVDALDRRDPDEAERETVAHLQHARQL
jgi:DNA-binding GntR family transcriptional regulator